MTGESPQRPFTQEHQDRIDGLLASCTSLTAENKKSEALLREALRALREAEDLLEHDSAPWDGSMVAERIAEHLGSSAQSS